MSRATQTALIQDDRTVYEAAAGTAVGLSGVTFAVGLAALLGPCGDRRPVAGLELSVVFGALLLALRTSVAGFGAASRFRYVDAAPQPSAGIVAAAAFTGIWFIVGAIVSGAVGLGTGGRLGVGIVLGGSRSRRPRSLAKISDRRCPQGRRRPLWALAHHRRRRPRMEAGARRVQCDAVRRHRRSSGRVVRLAGERLERREAYGGFGARGRNVGAYVLIYLVVCSILAVLIGLVAFVTVKGAPRAVQRVRSRGATLVSWPFLTNGAGLLADIAGVFPALVGTVWLVIGAVLFAVPTGVGAAVSSANTPNRAGSREPSKWRLTASGARRASCSGCSAPPS